MDALGIRKHVSWDPKRQCFVGYVDYGAESNTEYVASEALVFLVDGIFANWKQPIAFFLTNGISGFNLSQLLKETLERLHDIGVNVVTLTLDSHQSNQSAVKKLGACLKGDIRSFFPHPSDANKKVYVFFDACHMMKLVRNTLHSFSESNFGKFSVTPVNDLRP